MFRVTTYVTMSPFTSRRRRSAAAKTRSRSPPRGAEEPHDLLLAELVAGIDRQCVARDERNRHVGARRPGALTRETHGIGRLEHARHHLRIDPGRVDVLRVDGKPRGELQPSRVRRRLETLELGPRRLRVDVVDRHGRNAAPVVDPGVEQPREVVVGEVRRRLDVHLRPEHEPRGSGRPQQLVERRLRRVDHQRLGLRAEVLDDHLLDVAVAARGDRGSRAAPRSAPRASRRCR